MLYAFGLPAERPVSIPMKSVLSRCQAFMPELDDTSIKAATTLIERRNAELHSGQLAFTDLPTKLWLADFYRLCDLMLGHQGLTLDGLLGDEEANAAREMIKVNDRAIRAEAQKRAGMARHEFEALTEDQQRERRRIGSAEARIKAPRLSATVECPVCKAEAVLSGRRVTESAPRLENDEIVFDEVVLPNKLYCYSCVLDLPSHAALHVFDLGGQFETEVRIDALEYYSIDTDPADFYEPDYGND